MGTRANIHIQNEIGVCLVKMYVHCDGYPSGIGQDIYDVLANTELVNGIDPDADYPRVFNGIGCMAAYLIMSLKSNSGMGGIYIESPESGDDWIDYHYYISPNKSNPAKLNLKISDGKNTLFDQELDSFDSSNFE